MTCWATRLLVIMLLCSFVLVAAIADIEPARYDVDPEQKTIGFSAVHGLVSNVLSSRLGAP